MLARSPPGPEELAELEAEVRLLELALRMCDLLPCKGGQAASAPPAADCGGGCSGGGNGTQLLSSLEAGPSLQMPAGHQRSQTAPNEQQALPAATSVPPSPEEAGTAGTAAGTAEGAVACQPQLEQATALQQRSRAQQGASDMCHTAWQQAQQQGGECHGQQQQQQRRQGMGKGRKAALSVQLASNDDEEGDDEGPRLSGGSMSAWILVAEAGRRMVLSCRCSSSSNDILAVRSFLVNTESTRWVSVTSVPVGHSRASRSGQPTQLATPS